MRAAEGRGAEGRGAEGRGAEGRGAEGRRGAPRGEAPRVAGSPRGGEGVGQQKCYPRARAGGNEGGGGETTPQFQFTRPAWGATNKLKIN